MKDKMRLKNSWKLEDAEETELKALWDFGLDLVTEKDISRKINKIQIMPAV